MIELRQGTQQTIRVGVLQENGVPVFEALLDWYWWKYLIKPDGTVVNIVNHGWQDIPGCDGVYYLTLTNLDTNILGHLTILINDGTSLDNPILVDCMVIRKNVYDSKYGSSLLKVTTPEIY